MCGADAETSQMSVIPISSQPARAGRKARNLHFSAMSEKPAFHSACELLQKRMPYSSTVSARRPPFSMMIHPSEIGRLNRLGPTLPGLKYSTPFFRSCLGTWLWP